MMDSTACLVRSDAPHFNLAFQCLSAGQYDMQEDNPISCHPKRKVSLVLAGLDFLRLPEDRRHARVRHFRLEGDMRPGDRFGGRISQPESQHDGTDPGWLWRDFVNHCDR
jgi:hypothetical protein